MPAVAPPAPAERRPPVRSGLAGPVAALLGAYVVLVGLVLLLQIGTFVPLGARLGAGLLLWVAGTPRLGLVAAVLTSMLVPVSLAFRAGPFLLTVGRLVGFAFLAGWAAAVSRRDGPLVRRMPLDLAVLFVGFAYALSIVVNIPQFDGPELGDAVQRTLLISVDFLLFLYAATSVLGAGRQHVEWVLRVIALAVAGVAVLGIVDWVTRTNVFEFLTPFLPRGVARDISDVAPFAARERGGLRRAIGTFEQPNQLGAAVTIALPLLLHFAATSARDRRLLYIGGAGACTLAGILTISRSVFICLALGLLVYVVASGSVRVGRGGIVAVVAVVAVGFAASPSLRDTMYLYFEGLVGRSEKSVQARIKDYDNVLRQFDRTPLAGSGPATWTPRALSRPDNDRVDPTDRGQVVLDNLILSTIAERGLAGLLALLSLLLGAIGIAVRSVRRARSPDERSLRAALLASLTVYAVLCALFDMWAFYGPTKLYFLLVAATVVVAGRTVALVRPGAPPRPLEHAV
jgi:hypothetical protein